MSIKIRCPECGTEGRVKHRRAGTTVQCNTCRQPIKVPLDAPRSSSRKHQPADDSSRAAAPTRPSMRRLQGAEATPMIAEEHGAAPLPSERERVRTGVAAYLRDGRVWLAVAVIVVFSGLAWLLDWWLGYQKLIETAASRDPVAEVQLARFLETGPLADPERAVELYIDAARQNHAGAQYALGQIYEFGPGTPIDREQALQWYTRAAAGGSTRAMDALRRWGDDDDIGAQMALGALYRSGESVSPDLGEALWWYRAAAEAGSAEAQFIVGEFHSLGQGTPQDWVAAASWYERAATGGEMRAQYALAQLYAEGSGVERNRDSALKWYVQAANAGHLPAAFQAAMLQYHGEDTERDPASAAHFLVTVAKSTDSKSLVAAYYLGGMYFDGDGVPQDYGQAQTYFYQAGDAGHARAQFCLAVMYVNVERGRIVDTLSPTYNKVHTSTYWLKRCMATGGWETVRIYPRDHAEYDFMPEYGLVLSNKKLWKEQPPPGYAE